MYHICIYTASGTGLSVQYDPATRRLLVHTSASAVFLPRRVQPLPPLGRLSMFNQTVLFGSQQTSLSLPEFLPGIEPATL